MTAARCAGWSGARIYAAGPTQIHVARSPSRALLRTPLSQPSRPCDAPKRATRESTRRAFRRRRRRRRRTLLDVPDAERRAERWPSTPRVCATVAVAAATAATTATTAIRRGQHATASHEPASARSAHRAMAAAAPSERNDKARSSELRTALGRKTGVDLVHQRRNGRLTGARLRESAARVRIRARAAQSTDRQDERAARRRRRRLGRQRRCRELGSSGGGAQCFARWPHSAPLTGASEVSFGIVSARRRASV